MPSAAAVAAEPMAPAVVLHLPLPTIIHAAAGHLAMIIVIMAVVLFAIIIMMVAVVIVLVVLVPPLGFENE
jgi:hypothetical protein